MPVLVTQARNTDRTVRAYGVEFGASYDLSFLPAPLDGFAVSGNASFGRAYFPITLTDQSVRVFNNLPNQPSRIFNAALSYDKGRRTAGLPGIISAGCGTIASPISPRPASTPTGSSSRRTMSTFSCPMTSRPGSRSASTL